MAETRAILQPTFVKDLFVFEDPSQIPTHYDEWPDAPNFVGQWALFGWSGGDKTMNYAVDVISDDQAELLAAAKKQYFEDSIAVYRHSLDIYILDPNGHQTRYYVGRHI